MAISSRKLLSREDASLLFAACAFPVYSWSMLRYLRKIPSWQKHVEFWDMTGILAYAVAFALAESLLVFLALILVYAFVPIPIVRDRFVAKGSVFLLVNVLWAIVLHRVVLSHYILHWTAARYLLCAILYLVSVTVSWALVHRWATLAEYVEAFVDRLTVLLYVYVPLAALGILTVIARNIL